LRVDRSGNGGDGGSDEARSRVEVTSFSDTTSLPKVTSFPDVTSLPGRHVGAGWGSWEVSISQVGGDRRPQVGTSGSGESQVDENDDDDDDDGSSA